MWRNNALFFKTFLEYVEKYKNEILKNQGKIPLIVKYENNTKVECDNATYTRVCNSMYRIDELKNYIDSLI